MQVFVCLPVYATNRHTASMKHCAVLIIRGGRVKLEQSSCVHINYLRTLYHCCSCCWYEDIQFGISEFLKGDENYGVDVYWQKMK